MGSILILEDDRERLRRFYQSLKTAKIELDVRVWRSAVKMIAEVDQHLAQAQLVSLDHDLYPDDGDTNDPGDGLQVARHLAELTPICPVIIHTSNVTRGSWMQGDLELAGWSVRRVGPIGGDWVEADWIAVVQELLQDAPS